MFTEPKSPQESVDHFLGTIKRNMASTYYDEVIEHLRDLVLTEEDIGNAEKLEQALVDNAELQDDVDDLQSTLEKIRDIIN